MIDERGRAELEDAWRCGLTASYAVERYRRGGQTVTKFFRLFEMEGIPRGHLQRKPYRRQEPRNPSRYTGPDWIGVPIP